jgi:hypothetical protein
LASAEVDFFGGTGVELADAGNGNVTHSHRSRRRFLLAVDRPADDVTR